MTNFIPNLISASSSMTIEEDLFDSFETLEKYIQDIRQELLDDFNRVKKSYLEQIQKHHNSEFKDPKFSIGLHYDSYHERVSIDIEARARRIVPEAEINKEKVKMLLGKISEQDNEVKKDILNALSSNAEERIEKKVRKEYAEQLQKAKDLVSKL